MTETYLPKEIELIFRENSELAKKLSEEIGKLAPKVAQKNGYDRIKIMNFCGSHEWTTTHYGLRALMPHEVELIPGPGCPVCVTPSSDIENVINLAMEGYRIYTFGDVFKLPTVNHYKKNEIGSLAEAKSLGADVRIVYSFADAIEDAKKDGKESIFFGVGFETTIPSYAVLFSRNKVPKNLMFYSSTKLTAPAAEYAVKLHKSSNHTPVSGVIGPGHVSTIIGAISWNFFPKEYHIPVVVSGFEPIDILTGVLIILKDLYNGNIKYTNLEYRRVAKLEGNIYAQKEISETFDVIDAIWRGIGVIPKSGMDLKEKYKEYNARLLISNNKPWDYDLPPGCKCNEVTLGLAYPTDCPLFMKACTPARPWGPCMVSMEGACAVWARFGSSQRVLEALKEVK
ncbi:hydrogenase formation protein HypD [Saccharolobus shibatae]|uniref:[NiFe] hydrogenase metallocenter assembly protein HypD n=1 Tax=Saccharolobus shibatae TaxID=2286 RepID=A0A8F5C1W2_9CREN|nr:hydrogenase formation protein HypD [Saccharolobus shibatae]QXJ35531.1 [NiFe] hydrogenase metallocenter assembly protein HypD [Saccharolobus shibatae]